MWLTFKFVWLMPRYSQVKDGRYLEDVDLSTMLENSRKKPFLIEKYHEIWGRYRRGKESVFSVFPPSVLTSLHLTFEDVAVCTSS